MGYFAARKTSTVGPDIKTHFKNCLKFKTWPLGVTLFTIGIIGVLGDAFSTLLMLNSTKFEEMSGGAAYIIATFGIQTWFILALVTGMIPVMFTISKPKTSGATMVTVAASLFVVAKFVVFILNLYQVSLAVTSGAILT